MSLFYKSLTYTENIEFKSRKQAFKAGKPCAICGKMLPSEKMMVAHLVPVRELPDKAALFDEGNWEVRCIYCERRLHHEEQLRANARKISEPSQRQAKLQTHRQGIIQRRRRHRDIRCAEQELALRRFAGHNRRHRKRKIKHARDDYYAEP